MSPTGCSPPPRSLPPPRRSRTADLRSDGLGDPGRDRLSLQALAGLALAGLADAADAGDHRVAGSLGLVAEPGHLLDGPLAQHHRHEDLAVVDAEVVDAGPGDGAGVRVEVDDAGAGHLELA